jgi:hypothetical protein
VAAGAVSAAKGIRCSAGVTPRFTIGKDTFNGLPGSRSRGFRLQMTAHV